MDIWFCLNKNGKVSMHSVEPTRGAERWISNRPYVNSSLHKDIESLILNSKLTWASDPECISLSFK